MHGPTCQEHLEQGTRLLAALDLVEQLEGRVQFLTRELCGSRLHPSGDAVVCQPTPGVFALQPFPALGVRSVSVLDLDLALGQGRR